MAFRYSISAFLLAVGTNALDNGFGRTPVMGYNTYNTVGCSPNQTHVSETMDALVEKGFLEAGYKFFQVDCGWQGYDLQANGSITYDLEKFPDGIAPLSKAAIEKGFKWSMYTNQGVYSCDTETPAIRQGSLGHEKEDALQLAAWNVEYMKVDNCYVEPPANAPKDPRTDFVTRYTAISDALQSVGIKGIAICQWGTPYISPSGGLEGPSAWTPPLSNSYRVSDDIARGWANVIRILNQGIHVNSKNLSGPGHWSDMDMMEVGNPGMTVTEQASHFAVWAMFKSTLMISTSIPAANSDTVTILQNRDLIAINQDEAGLPVTLVQRFTNDRDVYAGDLANGDKAVLLLDHSNTTRTLSLDLASIGIASATVKNLWTSDISDNETSYSKQVDAHGSLPLRLSNIQKLKNTAKANITWIEAESGTVSNGAETQSCSGCSNTGKVGFLEEGKGTLTLSGIHASQETQDVLFDYVNCEIGYAFAGIGPNARLAGISVNGGAVQNVSFPLTGYNWDKDVTRNYPVRLEGFGTSGENTIEISGLYNGQSKYAPDIDRIGVAS